ncbi:mCG144665, partial [Mus musculus]
LPSMMDYERHTKDSLNIQPDNRITAASRNEQPEVNPLLSKTPGRSTQPHSKNSLVF